MLSLTVAQAEQLGRAPLVLYAKVLAKIEKNGDSTFTPAEIGFAPRTLRTCMAELKELGMAEFTKARRADAPYEMHLPKPLPRTEAADWFESVRGSDAGGRYPTLSPDTYVHFRRQYPALTRTEFTERLNRSLQSAVLADVAAARLMDWLSIGMERPVPKIETDAPVGSDQWSNAMERALQESAGSEVLE